MYSLVVVGLAGPPDRLTPDEAQRMASDMFTEHDHSAAGKPQQCIYWARYKDDWV